MGKYFQPVFNYSSEYIEKGVLQFKMHVKIEFSPSPFPVQVQGWTAVVVLQTRCRRPNNSS